MGFIQILPRPDGDNTRRVNGFVAAEIVGADMVKIDRFGNSRHLVDVAQETIQVQIIADAVFVTLKVGDIDRIKANQRRPQADIRFRQTIARQIAVLAEDLLQTLKRFKDFSNRFVVGFLAGGKTGLVNAVINVVVNPAVQLIDFVSQLNRIVIPGARAWASKAVLNMRMISADSLLTIVWFFLSHRTGTVTRPV